MAENEKPHKQYRRLNQKGRTHLYRFGKKGIISVRMERQGKKPLFKSTRTSNPDEAIRIAQKIIEEWAGKEESKYSVQLIDELSKEYLELRRETKHFKTYVCTKSQFDLNLIPFFGLMRPDDVNEDTWERFIVYSKKRDANRKLFNDRKYFGTFLRWLHNRGLIQRVPKLRNPDSKRKRPRTYSDEELDALLSHAGPDLRLQIMFGAYMGMRVGEIFNLEWGWIDWEAGGVNLPAEATKTKRERFVPLDMRVRGALLERQESLGATKKLHALVFPGAHDPRKPQGENKNGWRLCCDNAKVKRGPFRNLRHTWCSNWAKAGKPIAVGATIAGNSIATFSRFYVEIDKKGLIEEFNK